MSVTDRALAATKQKRHDEICKIVHSEIGRFTSVVGGVLAELRSLEMYEGTFESFVKLEFGLEKNRAYQLIEAHNTKTFLSKILDKKEVPQIESHLREIAKAPEGNQAEIAKAVAEICQQEQRKPTAKDFKQALDEVVAKVEQPKSEPVYEDMDDDEEIALPVESKPLAIENGKLIRSIINLVNEAKRELDAIEKGPGLEEICSARRSIERELNSVKASLVTCIPHSVCPRCKGKRCAQCGNLGWCNAVLAKSLMEAV